MYESIINTTMFRRDMPYTKASKGHEKLAVTLTVGKNSWHRYKDIRFVFHHDMVYITELEYDKEVGEAKCNCSIVSKHQHPFDMLRFGYTYKGDELCELALVDMAMKLYTNMYLDINGNGRLGVYYA